MLYAQVELKVNLIQRWKIPVQYEQMHAMQYKQSLLCFGTIHDNVRTSVRWYVYVAILPIHLHVR